jgi:hypothetical protein
MKKKWLNEPESYLLRNWSSACLLEKSMATVREKYDEIFDKVLDAIQQEHPELSRRVQQATSSYGGSVGIARQTWPDRSSAWPSGLWLDNISLERLASEDEERPSASVWIKPRRELWVDFKEAERRLSKAAAKVLSGQEAKLTSVKADRNEAYLWYPLPTPRQELLGLLQADDPSGFIDCMVEHFEKLTRFTPVVDEIFAAGRSKRK